MWMAWPVALVSELVEAFLARHRVDEATRKKLRTQLRYATRSFGERRLETLQPIELDVWRSQLPALSAHYIFRAFRQVLEYAVSMQLLEANPTARIRNTRAARRSDLRELGAGGGDCGRARPRVTRRSRRCSSAPACVPKSYGRSSAVTSMSTRAFSAFSVSIRTAP
jgi:hypothetical protein